MSHRLEIWPDRGGDVGRRSFARHERHVAAVAIHQEDAGGMHHRVAFAASFRYADIKKVMRAYRVIGIQEGSGADYKVMHCISILHIDDVRRHVTPLTRE